MGAAWPTSCKGPEKVTVRPVIHRELPRTRGGWETCSLTQKSPHQVQRVLLLWGYPTYLHVSSQHQVSVPEPEGYGAGGSLAGPRKGRRASFQVTVSNGSLAVGSGGTVTLSASFLHPSAHSKMATEHVRTVWPH